MSVSNEDNKMFEEILSFRKLGKCVNLHKSVIRVEQISFVKIKRNTFKSISW